MNSRGFQRVSNDCRDVDTYDVQRTTGKWAALWDTATWATGGDETRLQERPGAIEISNQAR